MKKFRLFTAAALLLVSAVSSQAGVFIYKGSARAITDTESSLTRATLYFQIFDADNNLVSSVAGLVLGKQKFLIKSEPFPFRFTEAPLTGGKTATIISHASTSGASNDFFSNLMSHFRGTNATLITSSTPGASTDTFPRLFSGLGISDQAFQNEGKFSEVRVTIGYQQARTIAANDAGQTIQQVTDAIAAELKAKGFLEP